MKAARLMLSWLALCALALGGCATTAPTPTAPALPPIRPDTIARLSVDGPNAYINGRRVPGGSYVFDGDTVSTGPGTSAILILNEGGYIQLDENTDPLFKQGACLLMKLFRGRLVFSNLKCQQFEDGLNMAGVAHSVVNIASSEQESRVTVIDGQVDISRPTAASLGRYAEYAATREGVVQVLQLTADAATGRIAWTQRYFRPPAARTPGTVSPAGAALIGVFIGGLAEIIGGSKPTPEPPRPDDSVPPEPRGWCCLVRQPVPVESDRASCAQAGGKFYTDRIVAARACRAANPVVD